MHTLAGGKERKVSLLAQQSFHQTYFLDRSLAPSNSVTLSVEPMPLKGQLAPGIRWHSWKDERRILPRGVVLVHFCCL